MRRLVDLRGLEVEAVDAPGAVGRVPTGGFAGDTGAGTWETSSTGRPMMDRVSFRSLYWSVSVLRHSIGPATSRTSNPG